MAEWNLQWNMQEITQASIEIIEHNTGKESEGFQIYCAQRLLFVFLLEGFGEVLFPGLGHFLSEDIVLGPPTYKDKETS